MRWGFRWCGKGVSAPHWTSFDERQNWSPRTRAFAMASEPVGGAEKGTIEHLVDSDGADAARRRHVVHAERPKPEERGNPRAALELPVVAVGPNRLPREL